jgi:BlaI family transcriptional regulator, penicillinase repressor
MVIVCLISEVIVMSAPRLGRVQLKIMQVLWEKGRANAREITESLCQSEPIAHSTVQTLLRKLEAKGFLLHEIQDRTFIFVPVVKKEKVKRGAVRDLMERVFGGSAAELATYLFQHEDIPPEELEQIRKLINRKNRKEG